MKKLPNLDALRFFLALLVIVFHLPNLSRNQGLPFYNDLPIFNKGIQAVYTFFILSGFLIVRLIYLEKETGRFSIRKFYLRRILRIFPLYYLVLIFGFLFYHMFLPYLGIPFETNYSLKEGLLLSVFFFPNIFAFSHDPGGILKILWSIGIEEQFYFLIAPLLYFLKKTKILQVLIGIAILYFIVFHSTSSAYLRNHFFVYFYLLSGGVIAILEVEKKLEFLKRSIIIPIIILSASLLFFFTNVFQFKDLWLTNLTAMVLLSLFIHVLSCNNFGIVIKNRIINYLGQISYGIYMLHIIALNAVVFIFIKFKEFAFFNNIFTIILINILTFALTIILAHLSYKYFEKPFLKLKTKFR
ncbi:Peptidoglycan/LPS O-acetylase OafA/YrhL, contains acyltransferase and SGNH-hydrolase domains [Algibacter pectinivorans]|uniref:Peptidoglycan/LPS O-acetylase OafA/YrhL, contains acyltransferase and SGNH-hydrolase domains n=1 Tax=Algibacter pectinivorans TaxID=870482 RepID=A0A1I1P7K0_9FLAO|nr:Peptidoglycan/LPS O-acetylase OafA/YrhL, contains acyltransferase and SGNH-hydrolase domains [Algibacter pectinivorans]